MAREILIPQAVSPDKGRVLDKSNPSTHPLVGSRRRFTPSERFAYKAALNLTPSWEIAKDRVDLKSITSMGD